MRQVTTMHFRCVWFCCVTMLILAVLGNVVFAQSLRYDVTKGEYKRKDEERVYVVGRIVNIAHELQHRPGGADAQDSLFSKERQGLKTSSGVLWTFVDNIKGQELQWNKSYRGKFIKIHGWVFYDAHYIEIDSFSIGRTDYTWSPETNTFEPVKETRE